MTNKQKFVQQFLLPFTKLKKNTNYRSSNKFNYKQMLTIPLNGFFWYQQIILGNLLNFK